MSLTAALPGYDDWLTRDDPANMPDDDDAPNAEDIDDELLATPGEIITALFYLADDENTPADVAALTTEATFDPDAMTPGQLLAVVINGHKPEVVKAAAYALRQHVSKMQRQRSEEVYLERLRQHVGACDCYAFED